MSMRESCLGTISRQPRTIASIGRLSVRPLSVARVNLVTGKVAMLPADKGLPEPKVKLPEELAKLKSQQYWTGADWKTDLFIVGKTVSALDVKQVGGMSQMSLKRWDLATGKPLETVELLRGKELWPQVSLDGQHVFVHQALVKEQLPAADYAWWVYSLATGKQVSKYPFEAPLNNVMVLGPRAYHLVSSQRARRRHVAAALLAGHRPQDG
jgi:hypothetical protein